MLNRRLFAVALVWLGLTAVTSMAQAEAAASPKVLFVVVDGIPADVIERVPTPPLMPSPWWGVWPGDRGRSNWRAG